MLVKTKIRFLFSVLLFAAVIFTTCDSPMGMGKQIDWEAPVLTLDPVPNPYYVRLGSVLTGTATDNEGVDRIIFTNTATGEELFPVIRDGINWRIELEFSPEQNGEKIIGQITAYDRAGNSGEPSIAIVTMIVDIRPPMVENITIQRTDTRVARLEPLRDLKLLETTDPLGEKKDELYRYQNGWFYINGVVNDEETKIEIISLDFYDVRETNTLLLSLPVDDGYTKYFPRWTIKEEDIINAGRLKWGEDYYANYYKENGERYYYRVAIKAIDMSENENEIIEEEEGFLCLFAQSDEPKGIFDPVIGTTVARGTPLPVDFYDDDSLYWAYVGLLTYEQWYGQKPISGSDKISGTTDKEREEWLKNRLRSGGVVYDWRLDKHEGLSDAYDGRIAELIKYNEADPKSLDEKLVYLQTGNGETDYGDYYLFTIAADKKLLPHDAKGPEKTNLDGWKSQSWKISVVDENVPLIVFDTEKKDEHQNPKPYCPEENTFPELRDGEFFDIIGYTLRENAAGNKKVETLRMAWIPFGMKAPGKSGPDDFIVEVQEALRHNNFSGLDGVEHWDFITKGVNDNTGVEEDIEGFKYIRQNFTKTFSVLNDFKYNGNRENETKLFLFYAVDNMGHEVFRQLRLLGMKIPPTLTVYDITYRNIQESMPAGPSLPNSRDAGNTDQATGGVTTQYYGLLNTYNKRMDVYNFLKGKVAGLIPTDLAKLETIPFAIYPRETTIKYWIKAAKSESDIAITNIIMKDVTFSSSETAPEIGNYNETDMAYTFCEYYPDVTQRTFLIEATDALGNPARIQRTIAVTNAAQLDSITADKESGTYGIDTDITLTAKFTNTVYLSGGNKVYLNIRYELAAGGWAYDYLECVSPPTNPTTPSMNLNFNFKVKEGMKGRLQTLYDDSPTAADGGAFSPSAPLTSPSLYDGAHNKCPIIVPSNTTIMDSNRKDAAFVPGYVNENVNVPNWTSTSQKSLQKTKSILLDGVRPTIDTATAGGKTAYTANEFYFKSGETILFTLTSSNKDIRANGTPYLSHTIANSAGTTALTYQRPNGARSLVFALPVNSTNCVRDGQLADIIYKGEGGTIIDNVNNSVATSPEVNISNKVQAAMSGISIYIKQTPPPVPNNARLNGSAFGSSPDTVINFNSPPTLTVYPAEDLPSINNMVEYSLDGGSSWKESRELVSGSYPWEIPSGTHDLVVRYRDKAGNIGEGLRQKIQVKDTFPKLIAASITQSNGWYKSGNLDFNLAFEDPVSVDIISGTQVSITVRNRGTSTTDSRVLTATAATNSTTIRFTWTSISGEMRDGLYISDINITGLKDAFGNRGGTGTGTYTAGSSTSSITITPASGTNYSISNLPWTSADLSVKVDAVAPTVTGRVPALASASTDDALVNEIKLTFREPVMRGNGVITIRPRAGYAIPPVFEDNGYYLGYTSNGNPAAASLASGGYPVKFDSSGANITYISSLYDVYNAIPSSPSGTTTTQAQLRAYLVEGSSLSSLTQRTRRGLNTGPYVKMTQGLISGFGYSGDYSGSNQTSGKNAPDLGGTNGSYSAMIPDTATKWVLDYRYGITQDTAVVNNIRTALTHAKWRWQEIDVVNATGDGTTTMTIKLNEPLLKGLEWDVYYPAGTFTDMAGNPAPVSGTTDTNPTAWKNDDYYFTSPGVQAPVIRVNRKSSDSRTANWGNNGGGAYNAPGDTTGWSSANMETTEENGWSIGNFNYVHFRVESESQAIGASISAQVYQGAATNASRGAAKGDWTGNVFAANYNNPTGGTYTDMAWNAAATDTAGTWVLPNIVRRSRSGGTIYYTVITKNGTSERRTTTGSLQMFKSYNKDRTAAELGYPNTSPTATLTAISLSSNASTLNQGVLEFGPYEASKSYVVGSATLNTVTRKGVEGVFRTVIMLNHNANLRSNYIAVEGSNIKNGMPSIAGFPVRDADENDGRYLKVFHSVTNARFYWVSTEIVSEWYFLSWGQSQSGSGGNGTHQSNGEVNNYQMVGYGDLTYGYDIRRSGDGL